MNSLRCYIAFCLALAFYSANAQTFLDDLRTDKPNQGHVTVTQSKEIDTLVNGNINVDVNVNTNENVNGNEHAAESKDEEKKEGGTAASPAPSAPLNNDFDREEVVVDTRKKIMRNSYKTQGYRIQVFSGGNSRKDRQRAETAGAVMKSNFPSEPIYVHFYSPSWKCRMGNYRTIEEARRLLPKVKKLGYPQANIIKGTISVQY